MKSKSKQPPNKYVGNIQTIFINTINIWQYLLLYI